MNSIIWWVWQTGKPHPLDKMADIRKDPVSLLHTLQLSSHSEIEGDSDADVAYTVEISNPKENRRNGENIPLIRTTGGGGRFSSGGEEDRKK